jgi:hypothetical protein
VAEATHAKGHACLQAVLFARAAGMHKVELEMDCLSLKTTLFCRAYDLTTSMDLTSRGVAKPLVVLLR